MQAMLELNATHAWQIGQGNKHIDIGSGCSHAAGSGRRSRPRPLLQPFDSLEQIPSLASEELISLITTIRGIVN